MLLTSPLISWRFSFCSRFVPFRFVNILFFSFNFQFVSSFFSFLGPRLLHHIFLYSLVFTYILYSYKIKQFFTNMFCTMFPFVSQMEPVTDAQSATNTLSATIMGGGNSSTSAQHHHHHATLLSPKADACLSPLGVEAQSGSMATSKDDDEDSSNAASSDCKSPGQRYVNLWSHRCLMVWNFSLLVCVFGCIYTIRIHVHRKLIKMCC